jgi:hypothetical protein
MFCSYCGVRQSRATDDAKLARRILHALAFFMFGEPLNRVVLGEVFGGAANTTIDNGLDVGLFVAAGGQTLRMNGLSLFSRQLRNGEVIYIFAETPPHFESRMAEPRVYIGADSYELMDHVSEIAPLSGYCVDAHHPVAGVQAYGCNGPPLVLHGGLSWLAGGFPYLDDWY